MLSFAVQRGRPLAASSARRDPSFTVTYTAPSAKAGAPIVSPAPAAVELHSWDPSVSRRATTSGGNRAPWLTETYAVPLDAAIGVFTLSPRSTVHSWSP